MFVGAVVVEDDVNGLTIGNVPFDPVEEADELLMPVALHVLPDDLSVQHAERGKEHRRAIALAIMGHVVGPRAFFNDRPIWVRSSACVCDFSSTDSTTACADGAT
jgi:hypothetical protein